MNNHQNLNLIAVRKSNTESESHRESETKIPKCEKIERFDQKGNHIKRKNVNEICSLYYDSRHQYDSEVFNFLILPNTLLEKGLSIFSGDHCGTALEEVEK